MPSLKLISVCCDLSEGEMDILPQKVINSAYNKYFKSARGSFFETVFYLSTTVPSGRSSKASSVRFLQPVTHNLFK